METTTPSIPSEMQPTGLPAGPTPQRRSRSRGRTVVMVGIGILLAFGLYECGSSLFHGAKGAESALAQFHERYNREAFNEIIDNSDSQFLTASREELVKFFASEHRKLGSATGSSLTSVNVNATTSGTYVRATFSTKFQRAEGTETVTWRRNGEELKLVGYNIQSNALVSD